MEIYPEKLMKYLKVQVEEGSLVTQTMSGDAYFWTIEIPSVSKYISMVAWYEGSEDFQVINLEGNAYKLLHDKTF